MSIKAMTSKDAVQVHDACCPSCQLIRISGSGEDLERELQEHVARMYLLS